MLWFAWKFVPLWYQQQLNDQEKQAKLVVICLKIRTFVVSATTLDARRKAEDGCDLLENSYLCGISNNNLPTPVIYGIVVICLKIRTFVVSATTQIGDISMGDSLWFAWKFVPLWYQQQPFHLITWDFKSCDLLENSYLCGISNNRKSFLV